MSKITNAQGSCVMTLKDIVDFINQKRGVVKGDKGYKQHHQSLKIIEKLADEAPNFGWKEYVSLNYNGQEFQTLHFTAKQAIAVGAKLDNGLLMDVIDKVEELTALPEPQPLSFNQMKIQALTKIFDQINALEDDTKKVERLPQIQKEPEVIAIIEALPQIRQDKATKKTIKHMTNHKHYHVPVANIIDIPLDGPKTGVVHFDFYNATKVIWTDRNEVTRKLDMPSWARTLDFSYIERQKSHIESLKRKHFLT